MADAIVNTDDTGASIETDNMNQAENYTDDTTAKGENMIPKSRFDQVVEQRKRATNALRTVADAMVEDVPEDFRDIIPELEPEAKITWIRNALKKGLFNKQVVNGLDSKRPQGKQPLDYSNMAPEQMMVHGYK